MKVVSVSKKQKLQETFSDCYLYCVEVRDSKYMGNIGSQCYGIDPEIIFYPFTIHHIIDSGCRDICLSTWLLMDVFHGGHICLWDGIQQKKNITYQDKTSQICLQNNNANTMFIDKISTVSSQADVCAYCIAQHQRNATQLPVFTCFQKLLCKVISNAVQYRTNKKILILR